MLSTVAHASVRRWRQEDLKIEASLTYKVSPTLLPSRVVPSAQFTMLQGESRHMKKTLSHRTSVCIAGIGVPSDPFACR